MSHARSTEGNVRAKIYRKAAKILEEGKSRDAIPGACSAISDAMYPKLNRGDAFGNPQAQAAMEPFVRLFKPEVPYGAYWGESWGTTDAERCDCRVVALCFMAAMVEAGDA